MHDIQNDILFAKFLNYYKNPVPHEDGKYYWDIFEYQSNSFIGVVREDKMQFSSDWNLLMEVVDRIESLKEQDRQVSRHNIVTPYRVDIINRNMVEILAYGEDLIASSIDQRLNRIEAVYTATLNFIKWYNIKKA